MRKPLCIGRIYRGHTTVCTCNGRVDFDWFDLFPAVACVQPEIRDELARTPRAESGAEKGVGERG